MQHTGAGDPPLASVVKQRQGHPVHVLENPHRILVCIVRRVCVRRVCVSCVCMCRACAVCVDPWRCDVSGGGAEERGWIMWYEPSPGRRRSTRAGGAPGREASTPPPSFGSRPICAAQATSWNVELACVAQLDRGRRQYMRPPWHSCAAVAHLGGGRCCPSGPSSCAGRWRSEFACGRRRSYESFAKVAATAPAGGGSGVLGGRGSGAPARACPPFANSGFRAPPAALPAK
jgi:hypothetical protein